MRCLSRASWRRPAGVRPLFGANLAAALQRRVGGAGILDVYASPGLALTHVVGPVSNLDRGPAGAPAAAGRAARTTYSPRAVQLASVERGLSVGLSFEVAAPLASSGAVLQVGAAFRCTFAHAACIWPACMR